MAFWIVLGVLVLIGLYAAITYNGLVAARVQVKNGWSQIDVQLKRRYDLIPNLVEVVKDSMGYEQETLKQVMEARSKAMASDGNSGERMAAENQLSMAMGKFFAVAENYPQLRAQDNVAQLMEELTSTENKVGFARQAYNDGVASYNIKVESFPSNIFAGMFHFTAEKFFDLPENSDEREAPKVSLR
ncbi:MAG: LemA family protein [Alphaproteobacteria bacterium]